MSLIVWGSTYRKEVARREASEANAIEENRLRVESEQKLEQETTLRKKTEAKNSEYEAQKKEAERRKLEMPWRDFRENGGWTQEYRDHLISEIKNQKVYNQKSVKILFLGPIRAGKSSFINSIASIDKSRIASPMLAGEAEKSLSSKLQIFKPKNALTNIVHLLDTMGLEETSEEGFNVEDVISLIDGKVRANYKVSSNANSLMTVIKSQKQYVEDKIFYREKPKPVDKVLCVVIVMDSMVIASDSLTSGAKAKLQKMQKHIREKDVPVVMLLTKIDQVCEEIGSKTSFVYTSRDMENIVRKASEMFGVTIKDIFPIRNYAEEQHLNVEMDILILLALRRMLNYSNDRLEKLADQIESESDSD